jgi:hypothetical protein
VGDCGQPRPFVCQVRYTVSPSRRNTLTPKPPPGGALTSAPNGLFPVEYDWYDDQASARRQVRALEKRARALGYALVPDLTDCPRGHRRTRPRGGRQLACPAPGPG